MGLLGGDCGLAQHMVHPTGQNVVDAPDIIAEVTQLETAFSLYLHLMRASSVKHFTKIAQEGR